jgi:hypothetical protein
MAHLQQRFKDLPEWPTRNDNAHGRSGLRHLQQTKSLARVALPKRLPPPFIVEIPSYGLLDPRLEVLLGAPS